MRPRYHTPQARIEIIATYIYSVARPQPQLAALSAIARDGKDAAVGGGAGCMLLQQRLEELTQRFANQEDELQRTRRRCLPG